MEDFSFAFSAFAVAGVVFSDVVALLVAAAGFFVLFFPTLAALVVPVVALVPFFSAGVREVELMATDLARSRCIFGEGAREMHQFNQPCVGGRSPV